MIIQIDKTSNTNKGAELMLYAILEEIEKRDQDSIVYYNNIFGNISSFKTNVKLRKRWVFKISKYAIFLLNKLNLPYSYFLYTHPLNNLDLVLDGAGFQFSDQWSHSKNYLDQLEFYYKTLKKRGTKIVLLPQAFGPFETENGKRSVKIISKYADLIFARENISFQFLQDTGINMDNVHICPDFSLTVDGVFPEKLAFLTNQVCIIPNKKMITHANLNGNSYLSFLEKLIVYILNSGKDVFILNHEGTGDLEICNNLKNRLVNKVNVVTGLDAKEIKGLIGKSYMVISSRYHGVASALNQGVPCLATSWNHKYEMLFNDFGQQNMILDATNDFKKATDKVDFLLDKNNNQIMKEKLLSKKAELLLSVGEMWKMVWND